MNEGDEIFITGFPTGFYDGIKECWLRYSLMRGTVRTFLIDDGRASASCLTSGSVNRILGIGGNSKFCVVQSELYQDSPLPFYHTNFGAIIPYGRIDRNAICLIKLGIRGSSSGVEHLLPKQNVAGSNPVSRSNQSSPSDTINRKAAHSRSSHAHTEQGRL